MARADRLAFFALAAGACVNTNDGYGKTTGGAGTHGTSSSSSAVGSTASSGTTSGTGQASTTSGTTTSGTTTSASSTTSGSTRNLAADCAKLDGGGIFGYASAGLTDCPPGQAEIAGQLYDLIAGSTPTSDAADLATDVFDPTVNGTLGGCGLFFFCVAPGTTVEPEITSSSYVPLLLPPITTTDAGTYYPFYPGLYLFTTEFVNGALPEAPLTPPFDLSLGTVIVEDDSVACNNTNPSNPTTATTNYAGWQFSLVDDAGMVVDAGVAFFSTGGVAPGATSTQSIGTELIYNIPIELGGAWVVGKNEEAEDGGTGASCYYTGFNSWGMSSFVPVQAQAFTFLPYTTP